MLRVDYGLSSITGGGGNDHLTGGQHDDVIDAGDGFADRVSCGEGIDRVLADAADTVGSGCETVQRLPEPAIAIDDAPPAISVTRPVTGAVFTAGRGETLAADATDDRGVAKVQFMVGDRLVCEDVSAPFTCGYVPTGEDAGKRTIVAIAIDSRQQDGCRPARRRGPRRCARRRSGGAVKRGHNRRRGRADRGSPDQVRCTGRRQL